MFKAFFALSLKLQKRTYKILLLSIFVGSIKHTINYNYYSLIAIF